jgi:quercetin dioxygenase-like cupin family protein
VHTLIGPKGRPIPLHVHEVEDEYFLCTHGQVQLWADGESRILNPGDFGYVPHGTIHSYGLTGHVSGFFGPILPGGWEGFFAFCGESFGGGAFPQVREPQVPFAKLMEASQVFHQTFLPEHPYADARDDAPDDTLPGAQKPYFLRAGEGSRHLLGGQLQTTLCGSAETAGTLAITTLLMGKGSGLPAHVHERTVEGLYVMEGRLLVTLDGTERLLTSGDFASIPAGTTHAYRSDAHYTKAVSISSPGGLERLFALAGAPYEHHVFPAEPIPFPDAATMEAAAAELDIHFVDA